MVWIRPSFFFLRTAAEWSDDRVQALPRADRSSHSSLPADGSALKRGSRSWFTLSTSREERFFLLLAVFIGLFSGLAVVCFRLAIDWTRISLLGPAPEPHSWRLIATPTVVGLIVAVLVVHVFPLVRGSGVNQTKAALYIYNGYIPFRTAIGKFITAAWPSARASLSDPKTRRCRSAPVWLRRSAGGSNSPANACACWPRWEPRPDWRPRSTRRFPRCCSSSKKSLDAGARAFLARSCCRRFRAWWWCAGFWGRSRCFAFPRSAWCGPRSCWPTRCWESSEDWRRSSLPRPSATSVHACEPGRAGPNTCNPPPPA